MSTEKRQPKKILVYGTGAIGSALGGFLSSHHHVTLLGRRKHIEAVRKEGLRVTGIWGKHCFRRFRLVTNMRDLVRAKERYDLVLVTVKSYDTDRAARDIRRILVPETVVISLQNGLGNVETLHRYIPAGQVMAGRVIFGVLLSSYGHIRVTVIADPTAIGETAGKKQTPRARRIAKMFSDAGLPSVPCRDVQSLLWAKVIYNAALNPLASVLNCHYGMLGEKASSRFMMEEVVREIYETAGKAGVRLHPKAASQYLKWFYAKLLPRTYHHRPSMLQDLEKGKRTEIDAINGAVVRLAGEKDVGTPVNKMLTLLIKEREMR